VWFTGVAAALLVAMTGTPSLGVDDLSLNVQPPTTVAPGGTVTVTLDVANLSAAINGVQIRIQYNPTRMTLIDVVPNAGPGWTEVSQTNNAGAVDWAAVINAGSTSANGTVATLTFTAISEGATSVTFRADAPPFVTKLTRASDNGTIIPNKINSGTITLTCSDGLFCNGVEPFSGGSCQPGTPPCVDAFACTIDTCDEGTDTCTYTPNHAACNNGLHCDGVEFCSVTLGCQDGPDPNCDDSVACTVDTCNETTDSCDHTPNHAVCSNGLFCDGAEVCHVTLGCQDGPDPNCDDLVACTVDTCNESTDSCDHTPNHASCSNGLFCDGAEVCHVTLGCQDGPDPNCDDSVACTVDNCNEGTDSCDHTPNHAACSNGLFCDGAEVCHVTLGCQDGPDPNCDDSVACTVDTCNESTDSCDHTPNHAACSNGLFCDGAEVCHVTLGCQDGPDPNCADAVPCTVDTCNESTDSCDHTPNHAVCANGFFCDGVEVCHVTLGCQDGPDPNCSDGIPCTVDTCNEGTDSCDHAENDAACNDGLFCNGLEMCDAVLGCVDGPDPCGAQQFCNETTDTCDQCSIDANCNDNNICTADTCNAGACVYTNLYNPAVDCCDPITGVLTTISDGDPCTTDTCNANGSVTHTDIGQVEVGLKLQAVNNAVTRDVTFVITTCGGAVDTRVMPVAFTALGNGTATLTGVDADADWIAISEGHTLRRLEALSFSSCQALVDVSGPNLLLTGDFHTATVSQDNLVDVVDFSILASRWNQAISANSSTGADATGNGQQNSGDFTAIQVNFFVVGEGVDACGMALAGGDRGRGDGSLRPVPREGVPIPRTQFPVTRLENAELAGGDANHDGIVDVRDIRTFAQKYRIRLMPDFERKLERIEREEVLKRQGR